MPKKKKIKVVDIVRANKEKKKPLIHKMEELEDVQERLDISEGDDVYDTEKEVLEEFGEKYAAHEDEVEKQTTSTKKIILGALSALIIVLVVGGIFYALPRADITVVTEKIPITFEGEITVNTHTSQVARAQTEIPGQVFSKDVVKTFEFQATGERNVERKAEGTIQIVNAYSSSPQILVETTRFETPDGKIFRTRERVTVPGASISGGSIEPSSIQVPVIADEAGEEYNIGPIEKFTIPGFKGSDKFEGFYGVSYTPMEGGYEGVAPYPTDEDMTGARDKAHAMLKEEAETLLRISVPNEFVIPKEALEFEVIDEEIHTSVDEGGKFSIALEGTIRTFALKEEDVHTVLISRGEKEIPQSYTRRDTEYTFGSPTISWGEGKMTIPLVYTTTYWHELDADTLKQEIEGLAKEQMQETLVMIEGVQRVDIQLWPFWVTKTPPRDPRIYIEVE